MADRTADVPACPGPGRNPKVLFQESGRAPAAPPSTGPVVPFGSPRPPSLKGDRPRILASGEVRHRIPCSEAALRELDPTAEATVIEQALRLVNGINLDDHHVDDVVRFGQPIHVEHGRLADEELALVGDAALRRARQISTDLLHELAMLDPEAVFAGHGSVGTALRRLLTGEDPAETFERSYPRIQACAQELVALAPTIQSLADRLRAIDARHARLDTRLAAHLLAGTFLVRHVAAGSASDRERAMHHASQAEALETRMASLAATRATLDVGRRTLVALARATDALAWSADGLLREELPAWHTAYSAALAASASMGERGPAVSVLRTIHLRILGRVKQEGSP